MRGHEHYAQSSPARRAHNLPACVNVIQQGLTQAVNCSLAKTLCTVLQRGWTTGILKKELLWCLTKTSDVSRNGSTCVYAILSGIVQMLWGILLRLFHFGTGFYSTASVWLRHIETSKRPKTFLEQLPSPYNRSLSIVRSGTRRHTCTGRNPVAHSSWCKHYTCNKH